MQFLKKNYLVILFFFIVGINFYDYFFWQDFKKNHKKAGKYAIGKIYETKAYGRGTGYYYLYSFNVSGKEYKGRSEGHIPFAKASQNIDKRFLVLYLKNNVHNNALYPTIPVHDGIQSNSELEKWASDHPEIKPKLDSIPASDFFFYNYF